MRITLGKAFQIFNTPRADGGANQFVLSLKAFGKLGFVKTGYEQIVVGSAFAGENRAADIDERKDHRRVDSFIFRLHVVNGSSVRNVCVKTGDHNCLLVRP